MAGEAGERLTAKNIENYSISPLHVALSFSLDLSEQLTDLPDFWIVCTFLISFPFHGLHAFHSFRFCCGIAFIVFDSISCVFLLCFLFPLGLDVLLKGSREN